MCYSYTTAKLRHLRSALVALLAAGLLLFAIACGDEPTHTEAGDLDDGDRTMLCEELQEIGECTYTEEQDGGTSTVTFEPPEDCDDFSDDLGGVGDECTATYGDFIDCAEDCENAESACGRVLECLLSAH